MKISWFKMKYVSKLNSREEFPMTAAGKPVVSHSINRLAILAYWKNAINVDINSQKKQFRTPIV